MAGAVASPCHIAPAEGVTLDRRIQPLATLETALEDRLIRCKDSQGNLNSDISGP